MKRSAWLEDRKSYRRARRTVSRHQNAKREIHKKEHRRGHRGGHRRGHRRGHRGGHKRGHRDSRAVKWLEDSVSVSSNFERQALTSADFIFHIPSSFCRRKRRNAASDKDADDFDGCWNATLPPRFCRCFCVVVWMVKYYKKIFLTITIVSPLSFILISTLTIIFILTSFSASTLSSFSFSLSSLTPL